MAINFLNSIESITLPGTTTDYYIGGSGGGVASNALKIGSRTTGNTIAMELFHALNPVSLGISYSGGDALAFIDSVHSSFDSVLQFKTGGDERFRVGALNANTFQIKPAAAGNDVSITDNSGNAILYSDTSTQRIGIGTTSPTKKLEVMGELVVNSGFNTGVSSLYLSHTDASGQHKAGIFTTYTTGYGRSSSMQFALNNQMTGDVVTTADAKMTILEGGNVGIGTTSPGAKLDIYGESVSTNRYSLQTFSSTGQPVISIYNSNSDATPVPRIVGTNSYINMYNGITVRKTAGSGNILTVNDPSNSEKFIVDASGNVGIGTTSPGEKLEVAGDMNLYNPSLTSQINFRNIGGANYIKSNGYSTQFGLRGNTGNGVFIIENSLASTQDIRIKPTTSGWDFSSRGVAGVNALLTIDGVLNVSNRTNVGIGTTSPSAKLHVSGDSSSANLPIAKVESTGTISYLKFFNSSTGTGSSDGAYIGMNGGTAYFMNKEAGNLYLGTGDNFNLTLENGGNVGIGTTSPEQRLHISSSGSTLMRITGGGSSIAGIDFGDSTNTDDGRIRYDNSSRYMQFVVADSERMRITSSGNVGIGTTSPDYPLHVDDTIKIGDRQGTDGSLILQSQQGPNITFKSTGDILDISGTTGATNGNSIRLSDNIKKLYFNGGIGGTIAINRGNRGLMDSNLGGLEVQQQDTASSNGKSTFLSTSSSGTILRSTSYGSTGTSGDIQFQFGGGANTSEPSPTTKMVIKNSGNVGIGTTSPSARLEVAGASSSDSAPLTSVSLTGKTGSGTGWTGTSVLTGYTHSPGNSDPLVTNIVPIANAKYIITLTISGITTGRYERIIFGGTIINVYINQGLTRSVACIPVNTDPLEVIAQPGTDGSISIDSISQVGARDSAVNISDSSGSVRNEIRSGNSATSMYIGAESGESLTSTFNVNNIAVGYRTLKNNISGTANTTIGYINVNKAFATSYMTTLGYNNFPNYSNPGNAYSIGIGTNVATSTNITGGQNILLGNNMFMSATTANGNMAMGYNAMRSVTTGSKNVSLGVYSLFNTTTGSGNIALGQYALYSKTTGDYNLAIGDNAGRFLGGTSTAATQSSNSIFLGYKAGPNGDSQTNQIVIGHNAIGAGSNTATIGATTITKTILNGNVGIGTTSPTRSLHLDSSSNNYIRLQTTVVNGYAGVEFENDARTWTAGITNTDAFVLSGGAQFSGGYPFMLEAAAPNGSFIVKTSGNVGIGTTSPSAKLEINSTTGWGLFTERGIKDGSTSTYSHNYGAGNAHILGRSTIFESSVVLSTPTADATTKEYRFSNASDKLTVKSLVAGNTFDDNILVLSGSNVGIGTASPSTTLDVAGSITTSGALIGPSAFEIIAQYSNRGRITLNSSTNTGANQISLLTDGNARMVVNKEGNVGIGTTSPSEKLEVAGQYGNTTLSGHTLGFTRAAGNYLWAKTSGGDLRFTVNGNPIGSASMIINSLGNVGIGTTSPGEKLEVAGNIQVNGSSDSADGLHLKDRTFVAFSDAGSVVSRFRSSASGVFQFQDGSYNTNVVLNNNGNSYLNGGNVGIGTTSPSQKLEVVGNIKSSGTLNVSSGTLSLPSIFFDNDTNTGFYRVSENVIGISAGGVGWQFDGASVQSGEITLKRQAGTATSPNYGFSSGYSGTGMFRPAGFNDVAFTTNNTEKMRITSSGNVGIGTTAPSTSLHVKSTSAGSGYMTIENTVHYSKLDLKSTTYTGSIIMDGTGGYISGGGLILNSGTNVRTQFLQGGVAKMIINNGNVGIGTTSPSQKLEVDGEVLSDGYRVSAMQTAPAARNSTGTLGEIRITSNYIYVCYATNSWSRVALATSW